MARKKKRPDDETLLGLCELISCVQIARAFEVEPQTARNWLYEARKRQKARCDALSRLYGAEKGV